MNYVDHVTDQNNTEHTLIDQNGRAAQKVAGAYNLLNNTAVTQAATGTLTFTVNTDKTITISGVPTVTAYLKFSSFTATDDRTLRLVGLDSVTTGVFLYINDKTASSNVFAPNNINIVAGHSYEAYISVGTNFSGTSTVIKPMLTPDLTATYDDYVPYCMSNRELMRLGPMDTGWKESTAVNGNTYKYRQYGKIVEIVRGSVGTLTMNTNNKLMQLPSGLWPTESNLQYNSSYGYVWVGIDGYVYINPNTANYIDNYYFTYIAG